MGKTRAEVARRLTEALRDQDKGIFAPKDEWVTVETYLDNLLVTKKPTVEPIYWRRLEEAIRIYIKPVLGRVTLTKLTAQQLLQLYASIQAQFGPSRVQKVHKTIHKALHDAVKLDLVARNVAGLIEKPKPSTVRCKSIHLSRRNSYSLQPKVIGSKLSMC
jgi:hypothetical protein